MAEIYICIADGMADFMPNRQDYHACSDIAELRETIRAAVAEFNEDYDATSAPYNHAIPDHVFDGIAERGASALNWRLCVARETDRVLDVIGMTADEFADQE